MVVSEPIKSFVGYLRKGNMRWELIHIPFWIGCFSFFFFFFESLDLHATSKLTTKTHGQELLSAGLLYVRCRGIKPWWLVWYSNGILLKCEGCGGRGHMYDGEGGDTMLVIETSEKERVEKRAQGLGALKTRWEKDAFLLK